MRIGIFGAKEEEITGGWGRLRNEELHNLYISQNIIRVEDEVGGARITHWRDERCLQNCGRKT
jgi:hypothetical protein